MQNQQNKSVKTREEMVERMVDSDIADIKQSIWSDGDMEFLSSVLNGDGWVPYNQLSDEQVETEYASREFPDDEDAEEVTKFDLFAQWVADNYQGVEAAEVLDHYLQSGDYPEEFLEDLCRLEIEPEDVEPVAFFDLSEINDLTPTPASYLAFKRFLEESSFILNVASIHPDQLRGYQIFFDWFKGDFIHYHDPFEIIKEKIISSGKYAVYLSESEIKVYNRRDLDI